MLLRGYCFLLVCQWLCCSMPKVAHMSKVANPWFRGCKLYCVCSIKHAKTLSLHLICLCAGAVVDGGWSRWSPWSRCDKRCGGGRSIRTRSCSSPPPKNGGKKCEGEKNQVKPCNTKPCGETDPTCSHTSRAWIAMTARIVHPVLRQLLINSAYGCFSR